MAAFFRADHHKHDHPKIFDDPFAQLFLSPSDIGSIEEGLLAGVVQDIPRLTTVGAPLLLGYIDGRNLALEFRSAEG